MSTELTKAEETRLAKCEKIIGDGLTTFVDVGNALAEVRDGALHKATHERFDDYIRDRWHMERSHAYRLIDAAAVVEMSPIGGHITNERIARELKDVPPKQHRAVMKAASKDGAPTAATVREAAAKTLPPMLRKRLGGYDGPKPAKSGKEKTPVKERKEAERYFGALMRVLQRIGVLDKVRKHMDAVYEAIKATT